jgi:DNA-binding HxlR family transcriptional regulator
MIGPMDYLEQDTSNCSVGRTVDIVGAPWVLLILREVLRGVRRFAEMQDHLGVSRSVLTDRLDHLVSTGVLERRAYREPGQRERAEYALTQKGLDLYPVLTALRDWGDKYVADPEGPAMNATHRDCGAPVHVALVCEQGHRIDGPDDVERHPGPSARRRSAPVAQR